MANVQEPQPVRPPGIKVALGLAIGSFVLWLLVNAEMIPPGDSTGAIVWVVTGFYLAEVIRAFLGRKDTRVGIVVSLIVVYFLLLPFCWLGFRLPGRSVDGTSCAVADIIAVAASAIGLALFYLPGSRRYFHLVTVARDARRKAGRRDQ